MHYVAIGMALLLALAIIVIGAMYLAGPMAAARSFGLPPPAGSPDIAWWLRLKGTRDVVSGLVVLAVLAHGSVQVVGLVLLVEALIPIGDMLVVLAGKGMARSALGIHGVTALVMILAAIPLMTGMP